MAEYINRQDLDFLNDFCIDSGKYVGLRLDDVFNELATADVIERSEYEALKKENHELAIKYDNAMNRVADGLEEILRLRSKIDKAIEDSYKKGLTDAWECARKIGNNSQLGLEGMGFDFSELDTYYNPSWWVVLNYDVFKALEILKRNIGE